MKSTMFVQAETRSFFEPAFPPVQGSREEHYLCFYCRSRRYRQSLSGQLPFVARSAFRPVAWIAHGSVPSKRPEWLPNFRLSSLLTLLRICSRYDGAGPKGSQHQFITSLRVNTAVKSETQSNKRPNLLGSVENPRNFWPGAALQVLASAIKLGQPSLVTNKRPCVCYGRDRIGSHQG